MSKVITKAANSVRLLFVLVFFSWLIAGGLFAVIEQISILDSLYWAMTTMSTVGYGDVTPVTAAGKVLAIIFQAWSIFYLVPCAVGNIIDKVRIDEQKFTHAEQEWQENAIKEIARANGVALPDSPSDY